ncbi:hypothetical protein BDZ91DRAFT_851983 [Kalaharituber pfeilii]|nr:hypothetical protein BDZ91DRAFT_851983 [Kalaharituber pfeilii]
MASTSKPLDAYSLTDISPATYLTWTKFTFPDKNGGRTAIAVSQAESRIIGALYILLITIMFTITWDIILSLIMILFAPKRMTRTNHITMIAAWNTSDPLHVLPVLMKHAWSVFCGIIGKVHEIEFTWEAFGLDVVILLFALGGWGGSMAAGLKFPELLVIGTAAPANPSSVLYPNHTILEGNAGMLHSLVLSRYESRRSVRAIAFVEGYETKISELVQFRSISEPDIDGEQRYRMEYGYKVNGLDMGLQHLSHLDIVITGQCTFENSWYRETYNTTIERGFSESYVLWPQGSKGDLDRVFGDVNVEVDVVVGERIAPFAKFLTVNYIKSERRNLMNEETGISYYTITPSTAFRLSHTAGNDSWYATQELPAKYSYLKESYKFQVKPGRPPLKCWEDTNWVYKHWHGKTANLFSTKDDKPPVTIPEGIKQILSTAFVVPAVVTLGRSNSAGALKSSSYATAPDNALDAENASAANDMRRLVYAAFLVTRDLFREAAIAGAAAAAANDFSIPNVLQTVDGYLPGTGDFIVISRSVVALSFPQMVVVPCALAFLVLIAAALRFARKWTPISGTAGRWQRFVLYASGLQATQLYRLLDQALAKDPRPPMWSSEKGWTPVVSGESPNDLPIPELQVVSRERRRDQQVAELEDPRSARFVIGLRPASQYQTAELENQATDSTFPSKSVANNTERPDSDSLEITTGDYAGGFVRYSNDGNYGGSQQNVRYQQ